jgi:hypothetical protein
LQKPSPGTVTAGGVVEAGGGTSFLLERLILDAYPCPVLSGDLEKVDEKPHEERTKF